MNDLLESHLRTWLGSWPPAAAVEVVGHAARTRPGWDGKVHDVIGVASPDGAVVSVPPAAAAALGDVSNVTGLGDVAARLGGALGRMQPGHGALATIEAGFAMFAVGMAMTPELGAAVRAHIEIVQAALASWDAGRNYLNFTERRERGERLFGSTTYRRLQSVKGKVDPEDVFRSNHPVRLPGGRLRKAA